MFVRSAFNYDGDVVSHKTGLDCSESPSRAQQHFRDECDINVLVQRFARTGVPEALPAPSLSVYEDVFDFQSAMQSVIDAKLAFASLPSKLRKHFDNDPGRFLDFVHDERNRDEAISLGLVPPPPPPPAPAGESSPTPLE